MQRCQGAVRTSQDWAKSTQPMNAFLRGHRILASGFSFLNAPSIESANRQQQEIASPQRLNDGYRGIVELGERKDVNDDQGTECRNHFEERAGEQVA